MADCSNDENESVQLPPRILDSNDPQLAEALNREEDSTLFYDWDSIIGNGATSEVVHAVHLETSQPFAVKIIEKKEKLATAKQQDRMRNEIRLLNQCDHPHIARFYECFEDDEVICLVLELCSGGELFDLMEEKKILSEREAAETVFQILSAVEYMHTQGIVHRDLKPENLVYLNEDRKVIKLVDFGLAKQFAPDQVDLRASSSGTPAFIAPERAWRQKETQAVDIWSVGCILYDLLYGVPPFYSDLTDEDNRDGEVLEAVKEGIVIFPEEHIPTSKMAKDLIMKLLARDPSKRISAAVALQHPWIASRDTLPTTTVNPESIQILSNVGRMAKRSTLNKVIDLKVSECDFEEDPEEADDMISKEEQGNEF